MPTGCPIRSETVHIMFAVSWFTPAVSASFPCGHLQLPGVLDAAVGAKVIYGPQARRRLNRVAQRCPAVEDDPELDHAKEHYGEYGKDQRELDED